jgi:glycine/D-amino acid oxidase-like deaminating enzyme
LEIRPAKGGLYRFPGKELALQHAKRMIDTAVQFLPAISGANVKQVYIGWRPLPLDGHPVLGVSPFVLTSTLR